MSSEDVNCIADDFNGDGRIDLIVASGGSEYSSFSPELRDRLYLNTGEMNFNKIDNAFLQLQHLKVLLLFLLMISIKMEILIYLLEQG